MRKAIRCKEGVAIYASLLMTYCVLGNHQVFSFHTVKLLVSFSHQKLKHHTHHTHSKPFT